MKVCYKNCRMINEQNQCVIKDLVIENGIIIEKQKAYDKIINMNGALVTPGLVDLHVHLREPGQTEKEDILSGTQAAANGGFTEIYTMPNVSPVPDTIKRYQAIQKLIKQKACVKVEQIAPITQDISTTRLVDIQNFPTRLFSNDGKGVQDARTMFKAMEQIALKDGICIAHTEDESLSQTGVMHLGKQSEKLNLTGFSELSEATQIARDLLLAQKTACHYHVCHLSAKTSLELIKIAKKQGVKVTSEVTPHHLLLCDTDVTLDSNYKMNPPLRSEADRNALLEGLLNGDIECIASDHAPHTEKEKAKGFKAAPFGIIGLDFVFPLLYTKLVKTEKMPLHILVERLTQGPRKILGKSLELKPGAIADLAFFDLETEFILTEDFIQSKSKNTPFLNEKLYGQCIHCVVDGKVVMDKGGNLWSAY